MLCWSEETFLQGTLHVNITTLEQVEKFKNPRNFFSSDESQEVELSARITDLAFGPQKGRF